MSPALHLALCRALAPRLPRASDAELLREFMRRRDAAAFEQLVERYAPLVWGVCRRVLPGEADREDAFQATFLALARQARRLDGGRALGGWLYTVAVRAARRARGRTLRARPLSPEAVAPGRDASGEAAGRELLRAVDEELAGLPERLRGPLVLCCLEGKTRDEAAEALGCSAAAVKGRLERGRALLRRRLERRGVGLPAAFLVLGLTAGRVAAGLRARAVRAALGTPPPGVAVLLAAPRPVGTAFAAALALLTAGALGVAAAGLSRAPTASGPPDDPPAAKDAAPPPAAAEAPARDRFGDPLPPGAVRRFGTVRYRHGEITAVAFTPDGKHLLAGSGRTPVAVFDAATGWKVRAVGQQDINNIYPFALSPDGKTLATTGFDVRLWDVATGRKLRDLGLGRCQAVAFSPDGSRVVAVRELSGETSVVNAASGAKLAGWQAGNKGAEYTFVRAVAFTPDGSTVALPAAGARKEKAGGSTQGPTTVRLWDAATGKPGRTFGGDDDDVSAFAFQPGTGHLATAGKGCVLRFRDVRTGAEVRRVEAGKAGEAAAALHFSADGRRCVVLAGNESLRVVDLGTGKVLREIRAKAASDFAPPAAALSPDGRAVALARLYGESCVRVWDVDTGAERLSGGGHRGPVRALKLSGDGRSLLTRGADGLAYRWDLRTGEPRPAGWNPEVPRDEWTGNAAIYGGPRWRLRVPFDTLDMEVRSPDGTRVLARAKAPSVPRGFAVSPDGSRLAVAFQDRLHSVFLWDPEHEKEPRPLTGHPDACQKLLFTHDGKRLIAGAGTHNAYPGEMLFVYDVASARLVRKLPCHSAPGAMLLTADDRVLVTGGLWNDAAVRAWDLGTGEPLATLADPSLRQTSQDLSKADLQLSAATLALSPDERLLAVVTGAGETSAVSVWETATWRLVRAFPPARPRAGATAVAFGPDGRSLYVASGDSTVLEWDVAGRGGRAAPAAARTEALWEAIGGPPDRAWPAAWELCDRPAEAVRFLAERLAPARGAPDGQRLRELVARLDADDFREREAAARDLRALGPPAVRPLRELLKGEPRPGVRERLGKIVEALSGPPGPEEQRALRAVAVLEWTGRADADDVLRRVAGGLPSARLTAAARAALERRAKK